MNYLNLSDEIQERIINDRNNHLINPYRCSDDMVIRRNMDHDVSNLWRPAFIRDTEKIMHLPYYNRYADKTQVFSFYKNDDITRRALHVQFVSRIARNIGRVLGLNNDLIEAMALGHDIGHTPFGHAGEHFLSEIYYGNTGRYFNHNVQSVRVLDGIFKRNISLQTLDGIVCHNGEFEQQEYIPCEMKSFDEYDNKVEKCYVDKAAIGQLIPSTLEGCVVRICDMIAYLGKDRQDAVKAHLLKDTSMFTKGAIGVENAEIINNLIVNIIENSYGNNYIKMDKEYYEALSLAKRENYEYIYKDERIDSLYNEIQPMFEMMYSYLLKDVKNHNESSYIYQHHIKYVEEYRKYYPQDRQYSEEMPDQIVVDYIASMTDDYFIDLFNELFPGKNAIKFIPYF